MERMVAELPEDEREAFRAFEAADPVGEVDPLANNPWERRQLAHRVSPMILEDWGCVLVEACRGLSVLVDGLKVNTSVEKVLVLSNHLGPEGAKLVESLLKSTTTLKHIDVQDNLFPKEGKEAIREAAAKLPGFTLVL